MNTANTLRFTIDTLEECIKQLSSAMEAEKRRREIERYSCVFYGAASFASVNGEDSAMAILFTIGAVLRTIHSTNTGYETIPRLLTELKAMTKASYGDCKWDETNLPF